MSEGNYSLKLIPKHIGIIMDGNRRWARRRSLSDLEGHRAGSDNLDRIIEACADLGIESITVYALSTENFTNRAKNEVLGLLGLIKEALTRRLKRMREQGVRLTIIGETREFPWTVRKAIEKASQILAKNERIKVNIALNYGGRAEIVKAVKGLIKDGIKPSEVDEEEIEKKLYTNGLADPDLVIRTGGQVRLSNFLLWQASYSELYFTNTLWPDFDKDELIKALREYENRIKNYGS